MNKGSTMREARRNTPIDPTEAQLRVDSVMPGVYLTFLVSVAGAVYAVVFADAASRTPVLALMLFAIFVAIVIWCMPWDRIVRSRWREPMFLAWSFGDIAVVAALAAIDGGGDSGLALVFFIPIVFAARRIRPCPSPCLA